MSEMFAVRSEEVLDGLTNETTKWLQETFAALANQTRLRILHVLTQQEMSVNQLCEFVGASQSQVSHQLRILRDRRLVRYRRYGNQVFYSVDDAHVSNLFREALSHLDHVRSGLPLLNGNDEGDDL
jgi:DNA-binding transcriptional ArsR family regulator